MSSNEANKEENDEEQILEIINELKSFQGILDSKDIKLSKKTFRVWAGHINYCITVIIEEFQKTKDSINELLSTLDNKNSDKIENIYI